MATFALIHGGGRTAWDWHLVAPELREHGHDPIAVDLPSEDRRPAGGTTPTRSSRQSPTAATSSSWGTARRLHGAARLRARPGPAARPRGGDDPRARRAFADWWTVTGYEESGEEEVFYHDVPPDARRRGEAERTGRGLEGAAGALAPRGLAGGADEIPPLPRRPHVPRRLGAPPCPRATRPRGRRDGRRSLHRPSRPRELTQRLAGGRPRLFDEPGSRLPSRTSVSLDDSAPGQAAARA